MKLLPVALRVEGARVLIVGGGAVAARKAASLLECGAVIKIIAPQLCAELETLLPQLEYSSRRFEESDCADCLLVFACTNDTEVNAQIAEIARAQNIWCHVADDASVSTLHGAAAIRRDEICIGVSTGGGSPALAKHLKKEIENCVGPEYSQLLQLMSERREALKTQVESQSARAQIWRDILASEVLALLREGKIEDAQKLLNQLTDEPRA